MGPIASKEPEGKKRDWSWLAPIGVGLVVLGIPLAAFTLGPRRVSFETHNKECRAWTVWRNDREIGLFYDWCEAREGTIVCGNGEAIAAAPPEGIYTHARAVRVACER
jgi:hypothetical protein